MSYTDATQRTLGSGRDYPGYFEWCDCEHCQFTDRRGRCEECGNHITIGNATVFDQIVVHGHGKGCEHRSEKVDPNKPAAGGGDEG